MPGMIWKNCGVILNMSSICWMIPATGMPAYVTSKAAIVGLTRALAHELGPHEVRVNCILPGATEIARQQKHWSSRGVMNDVISRQCSNGFYNLRRSHDWLSSSHRTTQVASPTRAISWTAAGYDAAIVIPDTGKQAGCKTR